MEVNVKMTVEEFQEFLKWQEIRGNNAKELERLRHAPSLIASSLRWAVEPLAGKPGKFKIIDQDHMSDAWEMAQEFMPKKV